jgi:hypothetical protein
VSRWPRLKVCISTTGRRSRRRSASGLSNVASTRWAASSRTLASTSSRPQADAPRPQRERLLRRAPSGPGLTTSLAPGAVGRARAELKGAKRERAGEVVQPPTRGAPGTARGANEVTGVQRSPRPSAPAGRRPPRRRGSGVRATPVWRNNGGSRRARHFEGAPERARFHGVPTPPTRPPPRPRPRSPEPAREGPPLPSAPEPPNVAVRRGSPDRPVERGEGSETRARRAGRRGAPPGTRGASPTGPSRRRGSWC